MKFTKTIIASLLGLTLATGVMAAEKKHQMIQIEAKDNGPAEVYITQDGELQVFTISQAALQDKEILLSELSGVSGEMQQHISQALSGLHHVEGSKGEIDIAVEKIQLAGDKNNFAFVTMDDDENQEMKVVIKEINGLHHDTSKNASFTAIQHLLKSAELSAEQLNTLQQLLDSKR